MNKKISGAEYPLSKIFSSDFEYIIPSYQRPYAWTEDETGKLFDDLYSFFSSNIDESYFLGSIMLIKNETDPHAEVIDGQQRLTTLTILLAIIAAQMQGSEQTTLLRYIAEPGNKFEGLEAKPRLTLRDRDNDFFVKYVQSLKFDELALLDEAALTNEARVNIKKNSQLLQKRITEIFCENKARLDDFIQFLLKRCFLVAVSTPTQQSAFRIFSVMNSRGLDLQVTDILKAEIIGSIASEKDKDHYSEKWEDIEADLGRGIFNDLFSYIRMIYAKEKAQSALLDEFRTQVLKTGYCPKELIDDILYPYAEALKIVKKSNYKSTPDAKQINTYLKWLNRIDNSDWIPPAIAFLKLYKDDFSLVLEFFKDLERLAAFMHLCAYNINDRIDRYVSVLKDITLKKTAQSIKLTKEEKKIMKETLDGNIYELTARRRNYIILRLDSFIADGLATYDASLLTIEHVLPQTINAISKWASDWPEEKIRKQWLHRIANLVPLNRRRNSQAQNYDFDEKKNAYFRGKKNVSSYALTTQVLAESKWTPDVVKARQATLLEVFYENWDL